MLGATGADLAQLQLLVVFLFLAADLAGWWPRRLIGFAFVTGLATLLVLDVVNPEALVVQLNTVHAQQADNFDVGYVKELSSDAVRALFARRGGLAARFWPDLEGELCAGPRTYSRSWAAYNHSDVDAAAARRRYCRLT